MNFDYTPKEEHGLSGKVVMRSLSVEERLDVGGALAEGGNLLDESDSAKAQLSIKLLKQSLGFVKSHTVSVDLKNKDGKQFKSYDELNNDESCHPVLMDMAKLYMEKMDLGKLLSV